MDAAARIKVLEEQLAERDRQLAERDRRIAELEAQVAYLTRQVAQLVAKLGQHSGNSHLPPSSDGPGGRGAGKGGAGKPSGKGSGRRRGGQPGHKGHTRNLLPPERVDEIVNIFPEACENCWAELPDTPDKGATRRQVMEIPVLRPRLTEFRCHSVTCACGHTTRADANRAPASPFGPRLMALVGMLSGVYHIGRRRVRVMLEEVFGVSLSLGAVSALENRVANAVEAPCAEAAAAVRAAAVKHADATSWLEAGKLRSVWALATSAATVFHIVDDGTARSLYPLFGACHGILVSDRATVFAFWSPERRQICWAHLLRRFVSFSEREGWVGRLGGELLDYAALLFKYWRDCRAGEIRREAFRLWMQPVQQGVEAHLSRLAAANIDGVSGCCADIMAHQKALWTFVQRADVEPTNNHAERELRGFVLWRKRCFGAQSQRGHVFAERIMTVAHTARKQGKAIFTFLAEACTAMLANTPPPSLLVAADTT